MATNPIKHVVVLMLENRSFDQMLGALKAVPHLKDLEGVDPDNRFSNTVEGEEPYFQAETKTLRIKPDPKHELKNVLTQIDKLAEMPIPKKIGCIKRIWEWFVAVHRVKQSYDKTKRVLRTMTFKQYTGKFVNDYAAEYSNSTVQERQEIMDYYPLDFLPALHSLGREYAICDQWFSSVPGPTWANRFFVHTGTALGRTWMPGAKKDIPLMRPYDQPTLYTRLTEKCKKWRIYFGDIPQSLVLTRQLERDHIINYRPMKCFYKDAEDAATFPDYCFIELTYFLANANDDHPPHNTMAAQCLIADVYNALRRNDDLWRSTLLVILYDEHGGFFDHIEPPIAIAPDRHSDEYTFNRYGVRVPALLVSPWVKKGRYPKLLDHTSLLKVLVDEWQLGPLSQRVANANDFRDAFDFANEPRMTLPRIDDSAEMEEARNDPELPEEWNGLQLSLLVVAKILSTLLDGPCLPEVLRVQAEAPRLERQALRAKASAQRVSDELDEGKAIVHLLIDQERDKAGLSPLET